MARHVWTEGDDVAALYLHKYGDGKATTLQQVAASRGISPSSLKMRIGNFKALESGIGLRNWARQSEAVFSKYGELTEDELKSLTDRL